MRVNKLSGILLVAVCAAVCIGQSDAPPHDSYARLTSIIEEQSKALDSTNVDSKRVSQLHQKAVDLLNTLPLSGEQKTDFLIEHIRGELVEAQKRERLLKLMINQLSQQSVRPDQLKPFASFLREERTKGTTTSGALVACIIKLEDNGTQVFEGQEWAKIIELHLKSIDTPRSILTEHILERAERENWKPPTESLLPVWSGNEQMEIGREAIATQRSLIAKRYVEEKLLK
jgi:hypothetical protein